MTRFRLPAIALTLLSSTSAWADLKTYDVDPQYQQEIYSALKQVLSSEAQARVELLPSGQILINASPETHEQLDQVLQAMRARPAPAAPRVSLRYWAVLGTSPQGSQAVGSAPPAMLNGVLSELKRLHSERTFRVIGTTAVTTYSGQFGEIKGTTFRVEQTAHVQGDTLNAAISMALSSPAGLPIGGSNELGSLAVRTTLGRGEFLVLGESHYREQVTGLEGPVFYIVHWER
jgi:hypothetical protein